MAKTQARKKTPPTQAEKPQPEFATYTMRPINRQAWNRFRARLQSDGRTALWAFTKFVEAYGNGESFNF